jgi:hypothetical protein
MNKYLFIKTIKRYGGSFYGNLASAMQVADSFNFDRIIQAFPELVTKYGPGSNMYQTVEQEYQAEKLRDQQIFASLAAC